MALVSRIKVFLLVSCHLEFTNTNIEVAKHGKCGTETRDVSVDKQREVIM